MAASISQYMGAVPDQLTVRNMSTLMQSLLTDLTAIRTQLNTHVHSGITAGGANTAVPTTTAPALNTTT